jgi:hypothetical protein
MPIGENAPVGYTPIPPSAATSVKAPNVVDFRSRRLDQVVQSFGAATGNPDVELRTLGEARNLRIVVPNSAASPSSFWTRIKAAFSNLPLFSLSSSLRAARLERDSKPQDAALLDEIVSVVEQEEKAFHHELNVDLRGQYTDAVRYELGRKPLTKRNVQHVLTDTLNVMSRYGAQLRMERTTALVRGTEVPVAAEPPALQGRRESLTYAQQLSAEGTWVPQPPRETAVQPRSSSAPNRDKRVVDLCTSAIRETLESTDPREIDSAVKKLYDEVRSFLIGRGKWPVTDPADAAVAVSRLVNG